MSKKTAPVVVSKEPVAKCFEDQHHKEYQVAYFDGYAFGDRVLEGVMFKATLLPNKHLEVTIAPDSLDYFSDLNMGKWTKEALEFALTNDVFYADEEGTGEEVGFIE